MKNNPYYLIRYQIQQVPEMNLVKRVGLLSYEIQTSEDREDRLLKTAQREYLLQELVRRDEKTTLI